VPGGSAIAPIALAAEDKDDTIKAASDVVPSDSTLTDVTMRPVVQKEAGHASTVDLPPGLGIGSSANLKDFKGCFEKMAEVGEEGKRGSAKLAFQPQIQTETGYVH